MSETATSLLLWIGDNLASFSPHLAAVMAFLATALMITGSRRPAALALLAGLPFGALVAEAAIRGEAVGRCPAPLQRLTAISVNLSADNRKFSAALDYIAAARPDILALQEAVHGWPDELYRLDEIYPHRALSPGGATRLYSRHKFASTPFAGAVPSITRSVGADIDIDGTRLRVIAAHFVKPESAATHRRRQLQMDEISGLIARSPGPAIVMGDFNAGPTSLGLRRLVEVSRLTSPALQMPPVTTWPARLAGLGIQIDHVLATGDLRFERLAAGPDIGSNHLPVEADLALDPKSRCRG